VPGEVRAAEFDDGATPEADDSRDESRRRRRGGRRDQAEGEGSIDASAQAPVGQDASAPVAFDHPVVDMAPQVAAPVAAVAAVPAPVAAPAVVRPYVLALGDLQQVAQTAGLEWVNSDAAKVSAVQAAIAAEPQPIRVPRNVTPVVLPDDGPLVLVETKRDLSALQLPFDTAPGAHL
jgi:ribonuclease E